MKGHQIQDGVLDHGEKKPLAGATPLQPWARLSANFENSLLVLINLRAWPKSDMHSKCFGYLLDKLLYSDVRCPAELPPL